ncbi:hypothetical protein PDESU_04050 [Pontiella desulfatans]|uniref:F5/8 type C domain-containing protein n=1 Tax=Pontiella desulfatans TaxID=2750659 RepID=A0A6C2U6N9_PONDE|nr:glycosyl hydrolase [Pontiella desulfatans]VGO15467.1 hypothetical protein PDESU_04050 [Pontiella desulfatans]
MKRIILFSAVALASCAWAEPIVQGDVTTALGPDFFLDEAATGGGDQTGGNINFNRTWAGVQAGTDGAEITVSGIGWASSSSGTTATQATATVTYLGADGVFGNADDVLIGSVTDQLVFSGAGEYAWRFDEPLTATIDGSNSVFRINVNTGGTGNIRYKKDNTTGDVKISVAGYSAGHETHNLVRYADVAASYEADTGFGRYATDGVVGFDYAWIGDSALPHTLDVAFPGPVEIGSYHLFSGANGFNYCSAFKLYYQTNGSAWIEVPGAAVSGNTLVDRSVIFPSLFVEKLRLEITAVGGDGIPRIREWAVFPPNDGAGYPLGTGVELSMAKGAYLEASSQEAGAYPRLSNDGYIGTSWKSAAVGPHTNDYHLRDEIRIGSVHLYSGDGAGSGVVTNFALEYSSDSGANWYAVPGGTVTGNTNDALVVDFSSDVFADRIRLVCPDVAPIEIREFLVFPENRQGNYPLGTGARVGGPPANDYLLYGDSFHHLRPFGEVNVLHVGPSAIELKSASTTDTRQSWQLLLNVGSDTYRIFNRGTHTCIAAAEASLVEGAGVVAEEYSAFPSQQWRISNAGDGLVYLENVWSGMRIELGTDGRLRQMVRSDSGGQKWNIDFMRANPKKGFGGGFQYLEYGQPAWIYNWGKIPASSWNATQSDFIAMQWSTVDMQADAYRPEKGKLPLTMHIAEWSSFAYPMMLLGYNEPDSSNQANMTVEKAIRLWPQLEVGRLPLASPATTGWTDEWMDDFMVEAEDLGYRMEYLAMHTYPGPNAENVINNLKNFSAAYDDRTVFLTEFGFVDWSDNQNWSENQLYHELLQLLWLLEGTPECGRYALFGFNEDSDTYPQPTDPTGRLRRTNIADTNGTLTAIGELWMGWNGELQPRERQSYILHNYAFHMRPLNDGSSTVGAANIRTGDETVQVYLEPTGDGYFYLVSPVDRRRLSQVGSTAVEWATADTASTSAQWSWSSVGDGWQLITNRGSGKNLRYTDADGVHLGTASGEYYHWFFVPPMSPAYPYADTYGNWVDQAFTNVFAGTEAFETSDPDGDSLSNLAEYFFLLDPLNPDASPVSVSATNGVALAFGANRHASDVAWSIETNSNLTDSSGWADGGFSIQSETESAGRVEYVLAPDALPGQARFYRVRIEQ